MSATPSEIRYATGEVAQVGDRVMVDNWSSAVEYVIATPEEAAHGGLDEPGLMMRCAEAGLFFEACPSVVWHEIESIARAR